VRLANLVVTGTLFAAVIAEGAYIIKTHRQMEALTTQVQQLAAESPGDEAPARDVSRPSAWVGGGPTRGPGAPTRLPPPRFAPTASAAPSAPSPSGGPALPPVLDTPEAREQLKQFVAAELQHQRDDWRQQQQQAREQDNQRRMDATIKALGLNADEGKRLSEVMTKVQDQRRDLREKIQSGQLARADMAKEFTALRDQTDQQIRAVIGDEKAQKFQELQRQNRSPGGGPGFGGGGPGFGGGGPGFGGPPPQP
jgi:hypothetical protein